MATGTHETTVRPRIIWSGVTIALLGMVDTGLMMVLPVDAIWIVVGVVIIAAGLLLSWSGGVMGYVEGGAGRGSDTTGVLPGARAHDPEAIENAVTATRQADAQLGKATDLTRLPASPLSIASIGLIVLPVWLTFSPWLFGFSLDDGAGPVILDQAMAAVVVGLCGLYLHQVGASVVVGGLAALTALVVVADGLFRHTLDTVYDVNQVVVGVLMLVGAVVAITAARAGRRPR
jgi:hypothetical protein